MTKLVINVLQHITKLKMDHIVIISRGTENTFGERIPHASLIKNES